MTTTVYFNPTVETNCDNAANEIYDLIYTSEFATLRNEERISKISEIIKRNIVGNVNFTTVNNE